MFTLDPTVVFLNHGSFGATPQPVQEAQRAWQARLERQPVAFLGRELPALLETARAVLGAYLCYPAAALAFVPNATTGVNLVARSLRLQPGDEILIGDHEYGACEKTWRFVCGQSGARLVRRHIPLPLGSADDVVDCLWQGVTPRTRLIMLSHITSPTAQIMPVAEVCARARSADILTLIDGAHAPGQLDLDLSALDADFYTGNCHKWLLSPKGAGFLAVRPDRQPLLEPLVVSWGWGEDPWPNTGNPFLNMLQWSGTADPSAYLSVPDAIAFHQAHITPAARRACHALARAFVTGMAALTGLPPAYTAEGAYLQMAVAPLPPLADPRAFQTRLYDDERVEMPVTHWNGRDFLRVSAQIYNSAADMERALTAVARLLAKSRHAWGACSE